MKIEQPAELLPTGETYFFLHIAKTAGSTFVNILDNLFTQREICPAYYNQDLREYSAADLKSYRFFRGHISYHLICSLLSRNPKTFVFLRNPYEHAISAFSHLKRKSDQDFLDTDIENVRRLTLKDYIYNPGQIIDWNYGNLQIRALTSKMMLENINISDAVDITATLGNLDYARKLLSDFMFLGLVERFEESLLLLSYTLGLHPIETIPQINVADNKPKSGQIPSDIYEKITQYSASDIALYNFAQQLFEHRLTNMSQDLLERYATAEQAQMKLPLSRETLLELLGKHYQAKFRERHTPTRALNYSFDQPLNGKSWYDREVNPDHGVYRWSGPGFNSTLDFPLAAESDLRVKFDLLMAITPQVLDSLKLEIEGQLIPLTSHFNASGIVTFEGIIPVTLLKQNQGLTRLTFRVNKTVMPISIDASNNDTRQLGIALSNLDISPL